MSIVLDRAFWKEYFGVYDVLTTLIPYNTLIAEVIGHIEPIAGKKVLELGCGTGNFSREVKKRGGHVTAVDFSAEALEVAKKKNAADRYIIKDISRQPLEIDEKSFDTVLLINVLYSLREEGRNQIMKNIYPILKKGGVLIMVDPTKEFSNTKFLFRTLFLHLKHHHIFILKQLVQYYRSYIKLLRINRLISSSRKSSFLDPTEHSKYIHNIGMRVLVSKYVYTGTSHLIMAVK